MHPETGVENLLVGRHAHEVVAFQKMSRLRLSTVLTKRRAPTIVCITTSGQLATSSCGITGAHHRATEFGLSNPSNLAYPHSGSDETELAKITASSPLGSCHPNTELEVQSLNLARRVSGEDDRFGPPKWGT